MAPVKRARLILALLALLPAWVGAAPDRDLENIKKKIENQKKDLHRLQDKQTSVIEALGKIQNEMEKRAKEIKLITMKLAMIADELRVKRAEAERLAGSAGERRAMFEKRAAALYRWQRAGGGLILFNGNLSLHSSLRRRHYLAAALSYDREFLTTLAEESHRQTVVQEELAQKRVELAEQKQALAEANQAIRQEAQKKQTLLAGLRREQSTRLRALQEMQAAARRLEKMMEEISRRALVKPRESPALPSSGSGLEASRGRLDWPVRGQITAPFGKFKHPEFSAELLRKGIDIEAPAGEDIKAVEKGRVVYADRFSGYGKMIIVDHGERYYTIYGHLSEMLKKTGDGVSRGEPLGRVGDSDSLTGSKLYFEIRKDGHSLDPEPWFRKR